MTDRRAPAATVTAWFLGEGDLLAGGAMVVSVQRDAVRRRVRVVTDAPRAANLAHDHRLHGVRQVLP